MNTTKLEDALTELKEQRGTIDAAITHLEQAIAVFSNGATTQLQATSTSIVERSNLTMRMQMRRLTRLTNGFSKKWENHWAALCLYFAWYNFVRVHKSIRVTPAMQAGITDRIWGIADLLA